MLVVAYACADLFSCTKCQMKVSTFLPTYASRAQGWIFLVLGFSMFLGFLYATIISKFLPASENHIVAAIQKDRYYCFLVPLTLPIIIVAVYFHWLSMKLFKHA